MSPIASALSSMPVFKALAGSVLLLFTLALVLFVRANSYFIADDYDHFIQAARMPLLQLLSMPIDVHYVPLHKLFSALILRLAPLNFDLALGVMLGFHGLSLALLYRLLQALSASPANLLIVLLYACNPFLVHPLLWWSSGIHRFPYVLLCLACLYCYARYRQSLRAIQLAGCYLAFVLAFGFYSKAILIPLYVLGLELCLGGLKPGRLVQRFAPGAVMLLLSLGYALWYLAFAPVMQQGPTPSLVVTGEIVLRNFQVMAAVLTLQRHDAPAVAVSLALLLVLALGIVCSALRERRTLWVWLVLFACVGINFVMVASSGRGQMFGRFLALALRYYWEVMFLIALFSGLLLAMLRGRAQSDLRSGHRVALLLCIAYIGALGWVGRTQILTSYEDSHVATARYMRRLVADLDRLPADRPLLLAQGNFPAHVYGSFLNFFDTRLPLAKVLPLRYSHLALVPAPQAQYRVDEVNGAVRAVPGHGVVRAP
ncbi:MAG: hypothetical protein V4812_09445 [Pseudomonadota bacterium]